MMQVQGSAARVNGEGTYTDSGDHGKQFSVGRLGNFDKSEETKMTESKILLVLDKKDYEDGMPVFERKWHSRSSMISRPSNNRKP